MSAETVIPTLPSRDPRPLTVWAFAGIDEPDEQGLVYDSLKRGKSRFGWSIREEHNLKGDTWSEWHSKQLFLLQIKAGDWIVHVNCPHWGSCVAVQATGEYDFDGGLVCEGRTDFRHYIPVDVKSVVEFDRRDQNIVPTVNLNPRQRYHRIYAVDDFLRSIDNLRTGSVVLGETETRELFHLREKTTELLSQITALLQSTHRSKTLERFFAKVFRRLPGVVEVNENGFGWGTDYGADLIITMKSSIANISLDNRVVVQVKSFTDEHYCLSAIEQVKEGVKHYDAVAGIIITTAQKTEQLESAIRAASDEIGKPIDLLAGDDVAKFVIENAPDLIFNLNAGA